MVIEKAPTHRQATNRSAKQQINNNNVGRWSKICRPINVKETNSQGGWAGNRRIAIYVLYHYYDEINTYGHPNREVLYRLQNHGITVYRTDLSGAVGVDIRKSDLKVDTMI